MSMAQAIQADAQRTHLLFGWVVARDQSGYPGKLRARFVTTSGPTAYVLVAASLAGLHAQLPPGLVRSDRAVYGPAGGDRNMVSE
jgi:hypothetical protein